MQRDARALFVGVAGGFAGTSTMSILMLVARRFGLVGKFPPQRIVEAALDATPAPVHQDDASPIVTVGAHFLFGMSVGAVFGLLQRRLPAARAGIFQGVVYGLIVWAVNYKGWIPAFDILPPPEQDRPDRPVVMVLAHLVYGGTVGAVVSRALASER